MQPRGNSGGKNRKNRQPTDDNSGAPKKKAIPKIENLDMFVASKVNILTGKADQLKSGTMCF